jgi:hypothetical protein
MVIRTEVSTRALLDSVFARLDEKIENPHARIDRVFDLRQALHTLIAPRSKCGSSLGAALRQRIEGHLDSIVSLQGAFDYSATNYAVISAELDLAEMDMHLAAKLLDYLDLIEQVHSFKERFSILCDQLQLLDDREVADQASKALDSTAKVIDELEHVIAFIGGNGTQLREHNRDLTQMGLALAETGLEMAAGALPRA